MGNLSTREEHSLRAVKEVVLGALTASSSKSHLSTKSESPAIIVWMLVAACSNRGNRKVAIMADDHDVKIVFLPAVRAGRSTSAPFRLAS